VRLKRLVQLADAVIHPSMKDLHASVAPKFQVHADVP
jgi:hypothetical protein